MTTLEVETPDGDARIESTRNGWLVQTDVTPAEASALATVLTASVEAVRREGGGRIEFWIEAVTDANRRGVIEESFADLRVGIPHTHEDRPGEAALARRPEDRAGARVERRIHIGVR